MPPISSSPYQLYYQSLLSTARMPDSPPPADPASSAPTPPAPQPPKEPSPAPAPSEDKKQDEQPPAPRQPTPPPAPAPPPAEAPGHKCLWEGCTRVAPDAEMLYLHLCNDHIGRKSTNNLCLSCKWKDCGTTCAKRDHITSHLRVHTPLKPHVCEICNKSFKRPQDLKKHEKIHTEEHHVAHKHSKAITVSDPTYSARVRGNDAKAKAKIAATRDRSTDQHSETGSSSSSALLNTPSPPVAHAYLGGHHADSGLDYRGSLTLPTWETLREGSVGQKRTHDPVDDFFTDMKKRRVSPSYNTQMAERLTSIAYAHQQAQQQPFNPRSVSLDIRTPEELAAVNSFLVTLGRDVTALPTHVPAPPPAPAPPAQSTTYTTSYFDAASLAHLGLAGMPGVNVTTYTASSGNPTFQQFPPPTFHPSTAPRQEFTTLYPAFDIAAQQAQQSQQNSGSFPTPQQLANLAARPSSAQQQPSPAGRSSPATALSPAGQFQAQSPHSSADTSSASASPPSTTLESTPFDAFVGVVDNSSTFDSIRTSRGPQAAVPTLAMRDNVAMGLKSVPTLQAAPMDLDRSDDKMDVDDKGRKTPTPYTRAEPVEPRLNLGPPIALGVRRDPGTISSTTDSLYPFLTKGDPDLKLPALNSSIRSSASPSPSSSSSSRRSMSPGSPPQRTILPSLSSFAPRRTPQPPSHVDGLPKPDLAAPSAELTPRSSGEESLAGQVDRIGLGEHHRTPVPDEREQRMKHAELIRNLLVWVNGEFVKKYGVPGKEEAKSSPVTGVRDVEMVA